MIKSIINELRISFIATVCLAVLLCGIYPALVWAVAQGLFHSQANGSLVSVKGQVIGSSLLAQRFAGPRYFHPRPSAAGDGYDAANSGGSNLGPTSQKLIAVVKERAIAYRTENNLAPGVVIPVDAVTASASGLDPHVSVPNAFLQARRVAEARGLNEEAVRRSIAAHTEGRDLGILGEPRVNILMLNLDLDGKG
ncbi:MAG: K(+)-transporting ATPase subunit C [Deltaproteobacteria bacterium]|nr:K(+)-transporting ATPase subunit C [Deltaproteobacteria bacterium]